MVGIRAVAGARLHSSGHVSTRATEIPFGVVAARASRDLAAEAMVARHPSGCDRTPPPGRLPRRVHLSIQPSYLCLARQTVLSPGPAGCAGRSGPVCNSDQTTAYCVRWREVNTPISDNSMTQVAVRKGSQNKVQWLNVGNRYSAMRMGRHNQGHDYGGPFASLDSDPGDLPAVLAAV